MVQAQGQCEAWIEPINFDIQHSDQASGKLDEDAKQPMI